MIRVLPIGALLRTCWLLLSLKIIFFFKIAKSSKILQNRGAVFFTTKLIIKWKKCALIVPKPNIMFISKSFFGSFRRICCASGRNFINALMTTTDAVSRAFNNSTRCQHISSAWYKLLSETHDTYHISSINTPSPKYTFPK